MSGFVWFLLVLLAGFVAFAGWRVWMALSQIRAWIARLARRDFRIMILDPPFGAFRRTTVHLREITEYLRRQSRQLSEEGFSLKAILGSMVEGVMLVDPALRIRLANGTLCRMFDLPGNIIDRNMSEVFRLHELRETLDRTFASGREQRLVLTVTEPHFTRDRQRDFEIYASPLHTENEKVIRGAVVVFHDVTGVRQMEKIRREFVSNVSHEFRTPLSVISGYLETLREDGWKDEKLAADALDIMSRHCDRLNRLIEDLLVISRLEQQQIIIQPRRIRLDEILRRAVDQLRISSSEPAPEFDFDLMEEATEIEGDPWRLEQVFTNLLANALRYGAADGEPVRVKLSLRRQDNIVELRCQDSGPGIPLADQPRIFERFYRVHKDRSRDAGGTGLGLSIVKNIVLAHGGEVGVESKPGEGATFIVRLPRLRPRLPTGPAG